MVSFLKRHSQPLVTTLSSTQDVVDFRTKENVTVVAYFDEDDHVSRAVFSDIAKVYRDKYLFGSISDDAFSLVEDVKKPSIVLYKTFDEGKNLFTEDIDVEKIKEFIANGVTPIVREIGVDFRSFPVNVSIPNVPDSSHAVLTLCSSVAILPLLFLLRQRKNAHNWLQNCDLLRKQPGARWSGLPPTPSNTPSVLLRLD